MGRLRTGIPDLDLILGGGLDRIGKGQSPGRRT
jgi:KaiC/GvpD/RAD55 family RecA-like ATPase